jgi:alpha,alpha-trehalose phosphorylase
VFAPRLPGGWSRYAFKLRVRAAQLQVEVDTTQCRYRLLEGDVLALQHRDVPLRLTASDPHASFPVTSA